MNLLQAGNNLMEEAACLQFWHSPLSYNVVKQLSTTCILHNKIKLTARLNYFIQLNNVRVPDELQNMHLTSNPLYICNFNNPLFLKDLDSDTLAGQDVRAKLDFAKRALSNCLS